MELTDWILALHLLAGRVRSSRRSSCSAACIVSGWKSRRPERASPGCMVDRADREHRHRDRVARRARLRNLARGRHRRVQRLGRLGDRRHRPVGDRDRRQAGEAARSTPRRASERRSSSRPATMRRTPSSGCSCARSSALAPSASTLARRACSILVDMICKPGRMSALAAIRPDDWNFALFMHVLGAILLVGALMTVHVVLVSRAGAARRPAIRSRYARLAFKSLLYVALPAWIIMRVGAGWIYDEGVPGTSTGSDLGRHRLHHRRAGRRCILLIAIVLGRPFRAAAAQGRRAPWGRMRQDHDRPRDAAARRVPHRRLGDGREAHRSLNDSEPPR